LSSADRLEMKAKSGHSGQNQVNAMNTCSKTMFRPWSKHGQNTPKLRPDRAVKLWPEVVSPSVERYDTRGPVHPSSSKAAKYSCGPKGEFVVINGHIQPWSNLAAGIRPVARPQLSWSKCDQTFPVKSSRSDPTLVRLSFRTNYHPGQIVLVKSFWSKQGQAGASPAVGPELHLDVLPAPRDAELERRVLQVIIYIYIYIICNSHTCCPPPAMPISNDASCSYKTYYIYRYV
jgi:hypothetical protein